jgi:hypothetical protein
LLTDLVVEEVEPSDPGIGLDWAWTTLSTSDMGIATK